VRKELVSVKRIERACLLNRVDVEMEEVIRDDKVSAIRDDKVSAILGDRVVVAVVEILGDKVVVVAVAILEDKVVVAAAVFVNVKKGIVWPRLLFVFDWDRTRKERVSQSHPSRIIKERSFSLTPFWGPPLHYSEALASRQLKMEIQLEPKAGKSAR
jgi:hypothetical protein